MERTYEYVKAKVIHIDRGGGWLNWWIKVQFPSEVCKKMNLKKNTAFYRLSKNYFKVENLPLVGDEVRIRCRLTKKYSVFDVNRAMIIEKI